MISATPALPLMPVSMPREAEAPPTFPHRQVILRCSSTVEVSPTAC
jgi:hypothetical protein